MNIAVVDDNIDDRTLLLNYLNEYAADNSLSFNIDEFESGDDFCNNFASSYYTIIFMDIYMDSITGVEAIKRIRETDKIVPVIFLTTSSDHFSDAFACHAYDYLLKPVKSEAINKLLDDFISITAANSISISLWPSKECIQISVNSIVSIAKDGHYIVITDINNNEFLSRMTFKEITHLLDSYGSLIVINRGLMISMDHITQLHENVCTLETGTSFPLNSRKAKKLTQIWNNYIFHKIRNT